MRHIKSLFITFICLAVAVIPAKVSGQSSVRTLTPPIIKVELSDVEPLVAGVVPEINYFQGGGGVAPADSSFQWVITPYKTTSPGSDLFIACGYSIAPTNVLTYPDGHQGSISESDYTTYTLQVMGSNDIVKCWQYQTVASYGMELGTYTLTLNSAEKQLTSSWSVDYPSHKQMTNILNNDQKMFLLMGFSPQEIVKLRLYTYVKTNGNALPAMGSYIASRDVTVDDNGTLVVDISVSRSAPFNNKEVALVIDGIDSSSEGGVSPFICPGSMNPRLVVGRQGRVTPGPSNNLRASPGTGTIVTQLNAGTVFTVVDGPICTDGGLTWWKVDSNGQTGGTAEGKGGTYWLEPIN